MNTRRPRVQRAYSSAADRVKRLGHGARPRPCPCSQSAAVNSASRRRRLTRKPITESNPALRTPAQRAAVVSSPLWSVSDVALRAFRLRRGQSRGGTATVCRDEREVAAPTLRRRAGNSPVTDGVGGLPVAARPPFPVLEACWLTIAWRSDRREHASDSEATSVCSSLGGAPRLHGIPPGPAEMPERPLNRFLAGQVPGLPV
jgi:hypothetical protein